LAFKSGITFYDQHQPWIVLKSAPPGHPANLLHGLRHRRDLRVESWTDVALDRALTTACKGFSLMGSKAFYGGYEIWDEIGTAL
jgi:hypothetical protein